MTDEPDRGLASRARLFAYSQVLVGGVAVASLLGTYVLLELPPKPALLVAAFCGAFVVYQLERIAGKAPEDAFTHPHRSAWLARRRKVVGIACAAAAAAGLAALTTLRPATLAWCVLLGVGALLYGYSVIPGGRRLKTFAALKPVLIAGAWSIGAVVLPVVESGAPFTSLAAFLLGYRFLIVLANAVLADWIDREGDARAGLVTIATRLPARRVRHLAAACALAAASGALLVAGVLEAPLLAVDSLGAVGLAVAALRPLDDRLLYLLLIDALVAWPLVTALAAVG